MKTLANLMVIFSIFALGCSQETNCDCEEPLDVWFKISNEDGRLLQLDMSKGYTDSDGRYVYFFVKDVNGEGVLITFPFGFWEVEQKKIDPFLEELEKEFKSLEEYLKLKGKGTEIKKQYNNKVGD